MIFSAELGIIFLLSILGGVLAARFKQPTVIGLLIAGAVAGPHSLGLISNPSLINMSIEIGAILLLFTVGIEFSLPKILNFGSRAIVISFLKLGITFLLAYYASALLGLGYLASLYLGVILSITGTVVFIKVLEQKNLAGREEMPLLITILIIEDIFAVFALSFFSGLNTAADLEPARLTLKFLTSLAILAVVYLFLQKKIRWIVRWFIKYSTEETVTFISLGLCAAMSYFAASLGLSASVGAFLAGNLVASLPDSKTFERSIHPFALTFTSLFFFSVGTTVNFSSIFSNFAIILVLLVVLIASHAFVAGLFTYLFGNMNGRQAIFSGLALIPLGEFSLLIANETPGNLLGIDLVSITATLIFFSSLIMSISISHSDRIYEVIRARMPAASINAIMTVSKYFNSISWQMIRDKTSTSNIVLSLRSLLRSTVAIIFIALVYLLFNRPLVAIMNRVLPEGLAVPIIYFLLPLLLLMPVIKALRSIYEFGKRMLAICVQPNPKEMPSERRIYWNLFVLVMLFMILILVPDMPLVLGQGSDVNLIAFVVIFLMAFIVANTYGLISSQIKSHASKFNEINKRFRAVFKKKSMGHYDGEVKMKTDNTPKHK